MTTQNTVAKLRGQEIENLPPKQRVAALLKANKNAIEQVLPRHVSPERLMQVAFSAVRTTPALLNCKSESLIGGIIQCAQLGLEPNTVLGHCYLIPFKADVQLIIGYKGLIDLARRSGQIVSIAAHVVRENDEFGYEYGLQPKLRHVPAGDDKGGRIVFAYAVAHLKDGGNAFEVMTIGDINVVMMQSQSKGAWGPWKDHFPEMARKTAIRRLAKYLPLSIEFASAVALDSQASGDKDQHLDAILSGEYEIVDEDGKPKGSETAEHPKARLSKGDDRPIVQTANGNTATGQAPAALDPRLQGAPVDSNGVPFDPSLHVSDPETGDPVANKDGSWRKRPQRPIDQVKTPDDLDAPPDGGKLL